MSKCLIFEEKSNIFMVHFFQTTKEYAYLYNADAYIYRLAHIE